MHKVIGSALVLGLLSTWSHMGLAAEPGAAAAAEPAPTDPAAAPVPDAAKPDAPAAGEVPAGNATAPDKDSGMVADAEAGGSPVELPGKTYLFVGARYRAIIVPKFMINLFGDGGKTVLVHAFGPEFAVRKNAFEPRRCIVWTKYGHRLFNWIG